MSAPQPPGSGQQPTQPLPSRDGPGPYGPTQQAHPNAPQPPHAPQQPGPQPHAPTTSTGPGSGPSGAASPFGSKTGPGVWLSLASIVLVVLAVVLEEDGFTLWDRTEAWSILAIAAAVLTLAPLLGGGTLTTERAWIVAAVGGGALLLWWTLVVLPAVASNIGLLATAATACGVGAAVLAPGRPIGGDERGPTTW